MLRRFFGSADHSAGDRTLDRAGAAQESVVRQDQAAPNKVSIIASAKRRWHDRILLLALPPGRESQSKQDQLAHLSRSDSPSWPAPIVLARWPYRRGSC